MDRIGRSRDTILGFVHVDAVAHIRFVVRCVYMWELESTKLGAECRLCLSVHFSNLLKLDLHIASSAASLTEESATKKLVFCFLCKLDTKTSGAA